MLNYIKQMLAGEDGKPSSNKLLKFAAFFASIILCILDVIFILNLGGYVGMFLGYAFGQDLSQKISNAVYNNGQKVNLLSVNSVEGK
jgi:hydrogenase/urease accessory protein HupE